MFYGDDRLNGVVDCLGGALLCLRRGEMKYVDEDGRDRRCDDGVVVVVMVMIRREGIANILNLSLFSLFFLCIPSSFPFLLLSFSIPGALS
jgi:hypothetical protein